MKLSKMIDRCAFALNYSPENEEYRDEIVAELNDRYQEISTQYNWLFLVRREDLTVHGTIEGSSTDTITVVTATNPYEVVAVGGTSFPSFVEGFTFVDPDDLVHTIVSRVTSSSILVEPQFTSDFTADEDWSVEFRRYPYPKFASEVLGISSRDDDRGKLRFFNWSAEERLFLDKDREGDPDFYVEDVHFSIEVTDNVLTLASGTAGGSLTLGVEFEYVYTVQGRGLESAPSQSESLTVTGNGKIVISGMPDLRDQDGPYTRGFVKRLYRRNKTTNGRFLFLRTIAESTTSFIDDGTINPSLDPDDTLYEGGPRAHHRVWLTPTQDLDLEVRYLVRPRTLQADNDVPIWPPEYHKLIVWEALVQLCLAHGMPDQAGVYSQRADYLMKHMRGKYLSRKDRKYIRRSFIRNRYGEEERFGSPRKV